VIAALPCLKTALPAATCSGSKCFARYSSVGTGGGRCIAAWRSSEIRRSALLMVRSSARSRVHARRTPAGARAPTATRAPRVPSR
jgi:hypothetical protein